MERLNVRCCCQPQKILGTLPAIPEGAGGIETALEDGRRLRLPIEKFSEPAYADGENCVRDVLTGAYRRYERTYKADGVTLEELRKIPVFEEAY